MLPTVALVGRPNVGKSTLFNKLTRTRDALVADVPGLTRDRRYGKCDMAGQPVMLIDTGGLYGDHALAAELTQQTQTAVAEADVIVLLLDGRDGITAADEEIVAYLRRQDVDFIPVINKSDGISHTAAQAEFSRFGFVAPLLIAASHNRGVRSLQELVAENLQKFGNVTADSADAPVPQGVKVAIVGRPNVGKSTLVNRLVGEERQVVFDMPGTTRDAIDIPFSRDGTDYVLIDTAGVRRKGKVAEVTEKFSVVKALQAMERAQVVILVLDANEGVVDQDLHVLQYAQQAGAALIVAVNKWDGLAADQRDRVKQSIDRKLAFVPWVPLRFISALHGTGVGHLFAMVDEVYSAGEFDVTTSLLTRLLDSLAATHPPPSIRGRQIKLKVATRAGQHPPRIAIHGNQLKDLPASYKKYLENGFREALDLIGNPVQLDFRTGKNPYAGRRNELTDRQKARRQRVIRHRKRR
ncbi:MAG: ribosome biogenesis GTPase Der [Pseudomonadota bacterium]